MSIKEKFLGVKFWLKANSKRYLPWAIIGVFVVIAIVGILSLLKRSNSSTTSTGKTSVISGKVAKAKATVKVGEKFEFMAINAQKKEVPVSFTIDVIERKDEIKLKGEPQGAPAGKDYVLVRIEIQNDSADRVAIATADKVRLQSSDGKLFAPDYHNGNVVIDPISVRRDLLAFLVDTDVKKLTLLVGELGGEKKTIEVNF